MNRTWAGKPIWSDRPGERFDGIADAAIAMSVPRSTLSAALNEGRECAGRRWFAEPPEWARVSAVEAERQRAAAVRCNPGPFGKIYNGTDVVTGVVYVNGKPADQALAGIAKGAAA
jgi:hypothetical protein